MIGSDEVGTEYESVINVCSVFRDDRFREDLEGRVGDGHLGPVVLESGSDTGRRTPNPGLGPGVRTEEG